MNFKHYFQTQLKKIQQKAANFLGQRVNAYSARKLKIGLIVSTLLIGIFCVLLIIGVVGSTASRHALQVDSISLPQKIHKFSMDSLEGLPSKVIDSLEALIKQYYTNQLR